MGITGWRRAHGEYLSIVTTMVDHDTPAAPPDRNVELRVVPPFPLKRLPGA